MSINMFMFLFVSLLSIVLVMEFRLIDKNWKEIYKARLDFYNLKKKRMKALAERKKRGLS